MNFKSTGYCFLCPVWGDRYVNLFLEQGLPSQLAPGNIPSLSNKKNVYKIFTTSNFIDKIQRSEVFKLLQTYTTTSIIAIDGFNLSNALYAMTECYNMGMVAAKGQNQAFVFLTPDSIWSDGSFYNMDRLAHEGQRAVLISGPRMVLEDSAEELAKYFNRNSDPIINISARELVRLTIKYAHPISKAHIWEGKGNRGDAHYYWRVGENNLLMRCFHLHPLMVWPVRDDIYIPKNTTLDHDFVRLACPDIDQVYVVTDSDEITGVDASPLNHEHADFKENTIPIEAVLNWVRLYTNVYHRAFFRKKIRFHSDEIAEEWELVEKNSDAVVEEFFYIFHKHYPIILYSNMLFFSNMTGRTLEKIASLFNKAIRLLLGSSAKLKYWI